MRLCLRSNFRNLTVFCFVAQVRQLITCDLAVLVHAQNLVVVRRGADNRPTSCVALCWFSDRVDMASPVICRLGG